MIETSRSQQADAAMRRRHGRPLADVVLELRSHGKSWRNVAESVSDLSGIQISYEAIRQWFSGDFVLVARENPTDGASDG